MTSADTDENVVSENITGTFMQSHIIKDLSLTTSYIASLFHNATTICAYYVHSNFFLSHLNIGNRLVRRSN